MKYHVFLIAVLFPGLIFSLHAAEITAEQRTIGNQPMAVTILADSVKEENLLGFGMEWEYEGDRPYNNVDNLVWANHDCTAIDSPGTQASTSGG